MAEIEDRWRDLGEFIREQRGQVSLRKVSEMAGISNPYLSQIERGLRKPSAEILRQIAGALQISAETLYVRAGILDEPDGSHDLESAISRDRYLDEEHKKTLLHIYRSFRTAYLAVHGPPDALAAGEAVAIPAELPAPVDSGDPSAEPDPSGESDPADPADLAGPDRSDDDSSAGVDPGDPAPGEERGAGAQDPGDGPVRDGLAR